MSNPQDLEITVRNHNQLGNALMRFRKKADWTQTELSEQSSVKQQGISVIENGATGIRLETLFKLLAALDLEIVLRRRLKS